MIPARLPNVAHATHFDGARRVQRRGERSGPPLTKPILGVAQTGVPFADFTASVGATANVTPAVSLGMETVASDAESLLWSRGNGAAIFFGPLVSLVLPGHRARLTVSGGPIVQTAGELAPTYTMIGKYAMPLHSRQTGYNLRLAVSFGL